MSGFLRNTLNTWFSLLETYYEHDDAILTNWDIIFYLLQSFDCGHAGAPENNT